MVRGVGRRKGVLALPEDAALSERILRALHPQHAEGDAAADLPALYRAETDHIAHLVHHAVKAMRLTHAPQLDMTPNLKRSVAIVYCSAVGKVLPAEHAQQEAIGTTIASRAKACEGKLHAAAEATRKAIGRKRCRAATNAGSTADGDASISDNADAAADDADISATAAVTPAAAASAAASATSAASTDCQIVSWVAMKRGWLPLTILLPGADDSSSLPATPATPPMETPTDTRRRVVPPSDDPPPFPFNRPPPTAPARRLPPALTTPSSYRPTCSGRCNLCCTSRCSRSLPHRQSAPHCSVCDGLLADNLTNAEKMQKLLEQLAEVTSAAASAKRLANLQLEIAEKKIATISDELEGAREEARQLRHDADEARVVLAEVRRTSSVKVCKAQQAARKATSRLISLISARANAMGKLERERSVSACLLSERDSARSACSGADAAASASENAHRDALAREHALTCSMREQRDCALADLQSAQMELRDNLFAGVRREEAISQLSSQVLVLEQQVQVAKKYTRAGVAEEMAASAKRVAHATKDRDQALAKLERLQAAAASVHAEAAEHATNLHARRLATARARAVESRAALSQKRLTRAKRAEARIAEMNHEMDELNDELRGARKQPRPEEAGMSKALTNRRDEHGRFAALPWELRPIIWAQLGRRVAPSAVRANIADVLYAFAPSALIALPCDRQVQKMRGELTIASEAIAAFRVAKARRIVCFGFDESTKWGLGIMSTSTQIEPHDAPGTTVDVVQRGATLTAGGTAVEISSSIEKKIFQHGRGLLQGWRDRHEQIWGACSWQADGGPDPSQVGIHRLAAEHALLMSDTCNAARAGKRMLASLAEVAAQERIGQSAWGALNDAERELKCKVYLGDCHGHLRNIVIKAMTTAATDHLKEHLEDSLAEFSSFDRMSVDVMDIIRALFKEIHPSGEA